MAFSIKVVNSKLLKNVLHHVDTHNRLMEEREMWNSRRNRRDDETDESDDYDTRMMASERRLSYGKMRSDNLHTETTREIVKLKEKAGKWNHSGFMELYPDEFLNKNSMDEMDSSDEDAQKNRKKIRKLKRKKRKSSDELGTKRRKRPKISEKHSERAVNSEPVKKRRRTNSHGHSEKRDVKRNRDSKKPLKERGRLKIRKKKRREKIRDESRRKVKSKHKKKRQERTSD